MSNIVKKVNAEGIAQECGICVGDEVVSVNGDQIIDYIDYEYYMADEFITLLVKKTDGEELEIEIEKDAYEDLGIEFIDDGFRKKICCQNKCLFCFVDQMPKGRRKTLYVKDDDWRLSFLMGNYVTLTNITQKEIDRIISKHISPLYLSVHASDKKIRKFLFGRENAADTFEIMKIFAENGIQMHTQIVMCEWINDGQLIIQTI
ncbi:MAG: PDZ domain-containing protein [Christensenellaceae bacterium]